MAGSGQPLPRAFSRLDIPQLRGLSSCSYSAQRLFFGSNGTMFANLESVWHADSSGKVLRVLLSAPQLTLIRWRPDETEDDAELAGFAERIMAQLDRRLAALPTTIAPASSRPACHAAAQRAASSRPRRARTTRKLTCSQTGARPGNIKIGQLVLRRVLRDTVRQQICGSPWRWSVRICQCGRRGRRERARRRAGQVDCRRG